MTGAVTAGVSRYGASKNRRAFQSTSQWPRGDFDGDAQKYRRTAAWLFCPCLPVRQPAGSMGVGSNELWYFVILDSQRSSLVQGRRTREGTKKEKRRCPYPKLALHSLTATSQWERFPPPTVARPCEGHTVRCVAVDAGGCCCVLLCADRLRASFNFRPWLGFVAGRYLAVCTCCAVCTAQFILQAAPQSWPTPLLQAGACAVYILYSAECSVRTYRRASQSAALQIPSCPVPLRCCNPSMRHMQLASPQPKTPVANGQPRSVALYRILHLTSLPGSQAGPKRNVCLDQHGSASQKWAGAEQGKLVRLSMSQRPLMGPRRSAWAGPHRSLTPRPRATLYPTAVLPFSGSFNLQPHPPSGV